MQLVNIHNQGKLIYLFCRNDEGKLNIIQDNSFFPYYYEVHPEGDEVGFDGASLKRMYVSSPYEITKLRGFKSYEADILFGKRYLIDKVNALQKCPIKSSIIDIEVLSTEGVPDPYKAKHPISCISFDNSETGEIKTFYLGDYNSEYSMIEAFIEAFKKEKFDVMLAWNMDEFDYPYLYNRIPDFANKISPINQNRYGRRDIFYPAGISIVDLLKWDKKVTLNRRPSYKLEEVLLEELKRGKEISKLNFKELNPQIKQRNINDVKDTRLLTNKKDYINFFDEIRRLAKVEWEDLIWNSRTIDMLCLEEAKNQRIRLPMKPDEKRGTLNEKEEFEGAFREIYEKGAHYNLTQYDLSSAYPTMIIEFCLDPTNAYNIVLEPNADCLKIEDTYFAQNSGALLPTVCKKLMALKKEIGNKKDSTPVDSPNYKNIKLFYDAIKTVVNSAYGVMGNRFFRLYDKRVASATTFLVRDLLHYVKDKLEAKGYKVVYIDTDSVLLNTKENISEYLNFLIQQWAKEKYGKESISLEFAYEGIYEEILLIALCRYKGYLRKPNGELEDITKGIEAKRKDSTKFIKTFQETLIDKILKDKATKEDIVKWIKKEMSLLKTLPLQDISFPCKISKKTEEYKNTPIFIRACTNTPDFNPNIGDNFYYVFMEGKDETKKQLVMAFDEDNFKHIDKDKIDWNTMIMRNIVMKVDTVFDAMGWGLEEIGWLKTKTKYKEIKEE